MPFDPHSWAVNDFFSASILDNDLYSYGGMYFTPNGIRFHAQPPLYKAVPSTLGGAAGNTVTHGNWGPAFGVPTKGYASIFMDNGGIWGTPLDKQAEGVIQGNVAGAGGGALNGSTSRANGGIYLMSSFAATGTNGSVASIAAGLGPSPGTTNTTAGSKQPCNSAHPVCAFCVDITDGAAQTWTPQILNGDVTSSLTTFVGPNDGSGLQSRMQAQWASVYTAFGATVGSAPSPLASWTGQNLTAPLLNGNTGLHDILRFLNMPPFMRISNGSASQSLTANTVTTITLGSFSTGDYDPYNGYASNTYTVPFSGLYLVHGVVAFQSFSGTCQAGVQINGTNYFGPGTPMPSANQGACTKTQVFSLNAGDTIKLIAQTSAASSVASAFPPRLCVLWLSGQGTPGTLPAPPDVTYRWTAGQPADLSTAMNAHIANDLIFLVQKPYLMAYQTTAQTGIAMGTSTTLVLDTVSGQVHGDNGDNYSGWSSLSHTYTAPKAGWYLAVTENSLIFPTLTSTPIVSAQFSVVPFGVNTWDTYQQANSATAGFHPGATGFGYYYLRAGDTIKAGVMTQDSSSTTTSTATGSNATSHFELVWVSE